MRHAIAVVLLCACACAAPFRAGAPVEAQERWAGTVYVQDGRPVDPFSLMSGLESFEGSRADAQAARTRIATGLGFGIAGGAATGYGLGRALNGGCDRACAAVAVGGLGVAAIGFAFDHAGRVRLERAVRAYNGRHPSGAAGATLVPWAAPLPAAEGRGGVAGIALRF